MADNRTLVETEGNAGDSSDALQTAPSKPTFEATPKPNEKGLFSYHHFLYLLICAAVTLFGVQQISTPRSGWKKKDPADFEPSIVRVQRTENGYRLVRNGEPYFIRGAGAVGSVHLDLLTKLGGNSIRTWAADGLMPVLNEAEEKDITVMIGLWVAHGRHGFDYSNPKAVEAQLNEFRAKVRRYKDHPALLLWGVGNEAEGTGEDENFWRALNDIAAMIKQEDPNHPTVTVLAEIGGPKIAMIRKLCPAIDILGVNSYKGLQTLPERLLKAGWNKPYIMTEYGPPGPWAWEVATTKWGAPIEMTSTEKAAYYEKGYNAAVATQSSRCLGSYAFIWGDKQEGTATWFGLLMPDGSMLASTLSVSKLWTGKVPREQAPEIVSLQSKTFAKEVKPGQVIRVDLQARAQQMPTPSHSVMTTPIDPAAVAPSVEAVKPPANPLTVKWDLRAEKAPRRPGDDSEQPPQAFPIEAIKSSDNQLIFKAPPGEGAYRLFVYVVDSRGYVATANMPFYVVGK